MSSSVWKVFQLGPLQHARLFFVEPYAHTFLPRWSLWVTGSTVPLVELVAGALLLVGWRTCEALVALGGVLVLVTFGHLLLEPLYEFHTHVIPRAALLLFLLVMPHARTVCRSTTGWPGDFERGKEARRTVQVLTKEKAPRYRRPEGATSYLLASPRTSQAKHLTTTLVQIDPGGEQPIHKHAPEQVYFVLEGSGLMTVGSETQEVGPGVCVFVPADTPHGIRNQGQELLRYFSAAAPAFDTSDLLSTWPLGSESEEAGKDD